MTLIRKSEIQHLQTTENQLRKLLTGNISLLL